MPKKTQGHFFHFAVDLVRLKHIDHVATRFPSFLDDMMNQVLADMSAQAAPGGSAASAVPFAQAVHYPVGLEQCIKALGFSLKGIRQEFQVAPGQAEVALSVLHIHESSPREQARWMQMKSTILAAEDFLNPNKNVSLKERFDAYIKENSWLLGKYGLKIGFVNITDRPATVVYVDQHVVNVHNVPPMHKALFSLSFFEERRSYLRGEIPAPEKGSFQLAPGLEL